MHRTCTVHEDPLFTSYQISLSNAWAFSEYNSFHLFNMHLSWPVSTYCAQRTSFDPTCDSVHNKLDRT